MIHSTGDDQSPLPTPGMKGGGGGKVVGEVVERGQWGKKEVRKW